MPPTFFAGKPCTAMMWRSRRTGSPVYSAIASIVGRRSSFRILSEDNAPCCGVVLGGKNPRRSTPSWRQLPRFPPPRPVGHRPVSEHLGSPAIFVKRCARALTNGFFCNMVAVDRIGETGNGEHQEAVMDDRPRRAPGSLASRFYRPERPAGSQAVPAEEGCRRVAGPGPRAGRARHLRARVRPGHRRQGRRAMAREMWSRKGSSSRRCVQYRSHVRYHILPLLGTEKLSRLTTPRVEQFRDELLAGERSRPLTKKVLASVKAILKEAQRRGLVRRTSHATSPLGAPAGTRSSSSLGATSRRRRSSASGLRPPPGAGVRCW